MQSALIGSFRILKLEYADASRRNERRRAAMRCALFDGFSVTLSPVQAWRLRRAARL
jgi:hypothetical protein